MIPVPRRAWPAHHPPGDSRGLARFGAALAIGAVAGAAGCGDGSWEMEVGPVGYPSAELVGLGQAQREELALLTAVGLAVAGSDEAEAGAPILHRRRTVALGDRLREEIVLEAAGVTERELEARYLTAPDYELVVRHLVVLSERWRAPEHRREARGRAEAALARIRAGEPFEEVAGEVSEEPGAARRGGRLEPGREGTWVPEFWEAARALGEGEVSGVVESEYGFHVLRLDERRSLPFSEARARVVGEAARDLGGGAAWEGWLEERSGGLRAIPAAVSAFDPLDPAPGIVLAEWPGGELTQEDAALLLRGLPRGEWSAFQAGEPAVREERIRETARLVLTREEADRRGIDLAPGAEDALEREWTGRVAGWAAILGFRTGMSPGEIREAALAALRATGQNARIARGEILEWSPALQAAYPLRWDGGAPPP